MKKNIMAYDEEDEIKIEIEMEIEEIINDTVQKMSDQIDELRKELEEQNATITILRGSVRRLRFQSPRTWEREDVRFAEAMRNKFVVSWDGKLDIFNNVKPEHMIFFGHLLALPISRADVRPHPHTL